MKTSLYFLLLLVAMCLPYSIKAQDNQIVTNGEFTKPVEFPTGNCVYRWTNSNIFIGLNSAGGTGNIASFKAVNNTPMPVVATFTAEPVSSDLAYIANSGSNNVSVVSTLSNTVVATILVGKKPFGVSVSPDASTVYVSNEESNMVSVISTGTNTVMAEIPVGGAPRGIVVSPDGKFIYVANSSDNTVSIVNVTTQATIATVPVGQNPYGVAVSPDGGKLYVTSNAFSVPISVIDLSTNTKVADIPLGIYNTGIAVTPDGKWIFVASSVGSWVTKIDASDYTKFKMIGVSGPSHAIAVDPAGTYAYVAVSGYITLIDLSNDYFITTAFGGDSKGISVTSDGLGFVMAGYTSDGVIHSTRNLSENHPIVTGAAPISLGNFIAKGKPCSANPVTFTITVNPSPQPVITVGGAPAKIAACQGEATGAHVQSFMVSGSGIADNIAVTAPAGFEVSLNANSNFNATANITPNGGNINTTVVYVRLASTVNTGVFSGNVILSSSGAGSKMVAVSGRVSAIPAVANLANIKQDNGTATPAITFTGTGNNFTWTNDNPSIGLAASGSGDISSFTLVNTGKTPVKAHITVTPASLGYSVQALNEANKVAIINRQTNAVEDYIPTGPTPVGVALSPDGTRAYVTSFVDNSRAGRVTFIDIAKRRAIATVAVDDSPRGITITPDGRFLYVANEEGSSVTVINTSNLAVVATVPVSAGLLSLTASPDGTKVYVADGVDKGVAVISTATNTVTSTINLGVISATVGISPDGSRLYVTNPANNTITVVDATTNAVITTVAVGDVPFGIVVSPDGARVFVANGYSGSVSVINTITNLVDFNFTTPGENGGIDISADGKTLYVEQSSARSIGIYDAANGTLKGTIDMDANSYTYGKFLIEGSGCIGTPVTFEITVNPTMPFITTGPATGTISACVGTASAFPNVQQVKVSGVNLSAGITATAPAGFQVSLNATGGYGAAVLIPQASSKVDNVVVYVRAAAGGTVGAVSGDMILSTTGGEDIPVRLSAFLNALPTVVDPGNQQLNHGDATTAINFTGTGNSYTWVTDNPNIGLAGLGTGNIASFTAINTGTTPAVATITVTPQLRSYFYIANSTDNTVSVIDPEGGATIKTIPVGTLPYGVMVSPSGTRVYVSNIADRTVSVINTASNTVIATVPVGDRPFGISVSPDGGRVYVANEVSNTVSVIDGVSNTVVATIPTGTFPVATLVSPDGGRLYVANQNSSTVSVFNTNNYTLITQIATPGQTPAQMALSPGGGTLYMVGVGNQDTFMAFNTATFAKVTSLSFTKDAHAIAVTPDGSKIYVTGNTENTLWVLDGVQLTYTGRIPVGANPNGVAVSSNGNFVFVVNGRTGVPGGSLSVIGTAIDQVLYALPVGNGPITVGNFVGPTTSCPGDEVSFTITVAPPPPPTLAASGTLTPLTTVYGRSSVAESFTVSGTNIVSGITVTAPLGFEVSADNNTFGHTAMVPGNGTVTQRPVYIRLTGLSDVGGYSGDILVSANANVNTTLFMPTGTVTPAVITVTADNKTRPLGAENPVLTVSYSGFVNNDNAAVITRQPYVITTATASSGAGEYPITVGDALALNYTFNYVTGVLTIQPSLAHVVVPNTFSPNDDGVNDTWNLTFLQGYDKATVNIFDRWGGRIYASVGYAKPWDGKRNGTVLPAGTYYYIINPKDGQRQLSGWVTILR